MRTPNNPESVGPSEQGALVSLQRLPASAACAVPAGENRRSIVPRFCVIPLGLAGPIDGHVSP